mmetsp:Transcript_33547/g.83077  ORF Transcript_33547/g.83077 Transcript_33547/m.83077 type:complete len:490 (-) Transcript_33547:257-1726(-)
MDVKCLRRLVPEPQIPPAGLPDAARRHEGLGVQPRLQHGGRQGVRHARPHLPRLDARVVDRLEVWVHPVDRTPSAVLEAAHVGLIHRLEGGGDFVVVDGVWEARGARVPDPRQLVGVDAVVVDVVVEEILLVGVPKQVLPAGLGPLLQLPDLVHLQGDVHPANRLNHRHHRQIRVKRRYPQSSCVSRKPIDAPCVIGVVGPAAVHNKAVAGVDEPQCALEAELDGGPAELEEGGVPRDVVVTPHLQQELARQVLPVVCVVEVVAVGHHEGRLARATHVVRNTALFFPLAPVVHLVDVCALLLVLAKDGSGEVPLQAELQMGKQRQQCPGCVEVHVICVVHEVLQPLQVQEMTKRLRALLVANVAQVHVAVAIRPAANIGNRPVSPPQGHQVSLLAPLRISQGRHHTRRPHLLLQPSVIAHHKRRQDGGRILAGEGRGWRDGGGGRSGGCGRGVEAEAWVARFGGPCGEEGPPGAALDGRRQVGGDGERG